MDVSNLGFNSKAIHAGHDHDAKGAHLTPIYQVSTFRFEDAAQGGRIFSGEEAGYKYTRLGNPNMTELEGKMAALENGEAALITSSGMSAISTALLSFLKCGDHVVASDTLYGGTFKLLKDMFPEYGIEVSFVDTTDLEKLREEVKSNTKVVYIETPANPTMKLVDIKACVEIAHRFGAYVMVDNTFMTPYLQRPLDLGADIVIHSATKYICGHGDVVAGIIVASQQIISRMKSPHLDNFGGTTSPFDAWLLNRGLKTLGLRMDKHCENATKVAAYLKEHPLVDKVYYPGLSDFPQYGLAKDQMDDFGGMIAFELKGGLDAGATLMNNVKMHTLAVSLGCVDSMIQHPASMTHACVPREERIKSGIADGLVRLSVGIEDIEDIIDDLEQALNKIK
ncbi:aminotransferase class I/II-fold pyridoxal phosphate-dependent enzyme [Wukongibacter baidiensis]|uniref:trans-sulfuration enzyme family protein n=1 Tax=Wukongibacter baidiensis TaxID=1723361 RepID=UPI003D7FF662